MDNFLDQSAKRFDEKMDWQPDDERRCFDGTDRDSILAFLRSEMLAFAKKVLEDVQVEGEDYDDNVSRLYDQLTALQDTSLNEPQ